MQVSVEATGNLERKMTVEVPDERIQGEVQKRLQQLARTTRIKGFRPGKVPLKVVASHYGDQVRQEVLGEVIQSSFFEAVTNENLKLAGHPSIQPNEQEEGKGFSFTATFEVMPEFEPTGLDGVEIEKASAEVTDADIDAMLEKLRDQSKGWEDADKAAEAGDRITIDFEGTIDGEEFKGNKGSNVPVELGSGRMIAGFEDGLTGAKAGEEKELDLTFPEDYGYKEVAGKPVKFQVKVSKVESPKLPEVNDEFAKNFGVDGIDALRDEIRNNMTRELEQTLKNKVKQQVMDKLLEANKVDIPQAMIDNEAQSLMEQMRQNMHAPQGKGIDLSPTMFEEQAVRRVSLGLIMAEIVRRNEMKADADKVRETVDSIAASYEKPEDVINWYYGDKQRLAEIESVVLEDQVVDWALSNAKVIEKNVKFDEIMNAGQ